MNRCTDCYEDSEMFCEETNDWWRCVQIKNTQYFTNRSIVVCREWQLNDFIRNTVVTQLSNIIYSDKD